VLWCGGFSSAAGLNTRELGPELRYIRAGKHRRGNGRVADQQRAFNPCRLEHPVDPKSVEPSLMDPIIGKRCPVRVRAFSRSCTKRSSSLATSPPRTECFDIFSPLPGESDVIS
jgi:hypothetical protein